MKKSMDTWFFMRAGFDTFQMLPDQHRQFLFGGRERDKRDLLLKDIEDAVYSMDGHKAVVFGDYGRGKTHMCFNLVYEIARRDDDILPVYIKCSQYGSKEPFYSFFRELVSALTSTGLHKIAEEYGHRVRDGEARPIEEIVQSEDIALVLSKGLALLDSDVIKNCMRWLSGEPKVDMMGVSKSLRPQLTDSREFGAVMRGLSHMIRTVHGKVPVYLVDEAERFREVSNPDTLAAWTAAMRELTELTKVGLVFFVGAVTRNDLPAILLYDEIRRRIGVVNYVEFQNPSRDQVREFLLELFATSIRKGEVPIDHRNAVLESALESTVPDELSALTASEPNALSTYPFTPSAFDEFVEQVSTGDAANKPSEILKRVQKIAQRAMRADTRVIDGKLVDALAAEGI